MTISTLANKPESTVATPAPKTRPKARRLRIALIGEGTYPVVTGGVSTWYDQLIKGLEEYEFEIVTIVGEDREPRWDLPANVAGLTLLPMWDQPPHSSIRGRHAEEQRVRKALDGLWSAVLCPTQSNEQDILAVRSALQDLSHTASGQPLGATLQRISSAPSVADAWEKARSVNPELPILSLSQSARVAHFADRILAMLDADCPPADLIHLTTNGPSALIGLARHWRDGTPLVLTEHGVYLRERYLAADTMDPDYSVRYALLTLMRLICQVTYREVQELAPVSHFNARWAERLGAPESRTRPIHNGVDSEAYSVITTVPEVPTVSFVGRIDPLKDLATLINAFTMVTQEIPEAKLRIFGPIPAENDDYFQELQDLVRECKLEECVTFEGRVPSARIAAEAGHVVALSSISEGLPFTVIESMMCGRATVSTDVGGVSEVTGRDRVAGILVPPRAPEHLAKELVFLLVDHAARAAMGEAARARAASMFELSSFYNNVRSLYTRCCASLAPTGASGAPSGAQHAPSGAQLAPAGAQLA